MRAASPDIIANWLTRATRAMASTDPEIVKRGAQRLFWLSKWGLSEGLSQVATPKCLEWLLHAAKMGSIEARATVVCVFSALGVDIPGEYETSLEDWLIDACERDEQPAQSVLRTKFPHIYVATMESLQTIYCGYGQDCFGEQWRIEYPLDNSNEWIEDGLQTANDVNKVHDFPGMACGMTWLHYASSCGRLDIITQLIGHGASPDVLNDYGETPLFMACQAGHFEAASMLCQRTQHGTQDYSTITELHSLDKFDEIHMETIAKMLLDWGIDINCRNKENGQTPLALILNRNAPSCGAAIQVLLEKGANPSVKDDQGLDCVAHAACNLSVVQVIAMLNNYPHRDLAHIKADALWFLLEMDEFEMLVRGGGDCGEKFTDTIRILVDQPTCQAFVEKTGHSAFTFACAKAPILAVRTLATFLSPVDLNEIKPSSMEWYTPLMAAIGQDRPNVVNWLLQNGATAAVRFAKTQWTPLFYAVSRSAQIVGALMKAVENEKSRLEAVRYLNIRDDSGVTAFDTAVAGEFFEAADLLREYNPTFLDFTIPYGEDSTCRFNMFGHTCYKPKQLSYLLALIADVGDLVEVDNEGATLLHAVVGVPIGKTATAYTCECD
jgi:ankyrin repeat protein